LPRQDEIAAGLESRFELPLKNLPPFQQQETPAQKSLKK
jgi:hypothetical protein